MRKVLVTWLIVCHVWRKQRIICYFADKNPSESSIHYHIPYLKSPLAFKRLFFSRKILIVGSIFHNFHYLPLVFMPIDGSFSLCQIQLFWLVREKCSDVLWNYYKYNNKRHIRLRNHVLTVLNVKKEWYFKIDKHGKLWNNTLN